jgi:hypothetical protein
MPFCGAQLSFVGRQAACFAVSVPVLFAAAYSVNAWPVVVQLVNGFLREIEESGHFDATSGTSIPKLYAGIVPAQWCTAVCGVSIAVRSGGA